MNILTLDEVLTLAQQYSDAKTNNTFAPCNPDFLIQNILVHLVRLKVENKDIINRVADELNLPTENGNRVHDLQFWLDSPKTDLIDDNKRLRTMLFNAHCNNKNHLAYGDDGEMWCNTCMIDFKRNSVAVIQDKITLFQIKTFSKIAKANGCV